MPAEPAPTSAGLVHRFTADVAAAHLGGHGVASGLGLSVLLALAAPAAAGEHRRRL